MKPDNPIKTAISTLRPGDAITDLNCHSCAANYIVVLERDTGGSVFELTRSSVKPTLSRDDRGPYRWKGQFKMFFDRDGRPHDHILPDSQVVEGIGNDVVLQYMGIPGLTEVRYVIEPSNLAGPTFDEVTLQKVEVLLGRMKSAEGAQQQVEYLQLVVQLLFGGTVLNERQMRGVLIAMNRFARIHASTQRSPLGGLGVLLGAMMSGTVGIEIIHGRSSQDGAAREQGTGNARHT